MLLFCFVLFSLVDVEKPVISIEEENVTGYTLNGDETAVVDWTEPSATDNSGVQTLTSSHSSGSLFPVGKTVVQYTSTDSSGNRDIGYMNIIVIQRKIRIVLLTRYYSGVKTISHYCRLK